MYKDLKKLFSKCAPVVKKIIVAGIIVLALAFFALAIYSVYRVFDANIKVNVDTAEFDKQYAMFEDVMAAPSRFEDYLANNDPFAKGDASESIETLENTYRVEFLNVGTADCTVVTNGTNTLVIDTGDAEDGKYIVNHLKRNGVDSVSIMLTNGASERVGGFNAFLSEMNVEELIVSQNATDELLLAAVDMANEHSVSVRKVNANDTWNVGEASVEVLIAQNNLVARIKAGATSFLLMSDASLEDEAALYEAGIEATVLKLPNHGANVSDLHFIRSVAPAYVVVSCGPETSNRTFLNEVRNYSTVYRTEKFGTLFVLTDGVEYKMSADKTINCDG